MASDTKDVPGVSSQGHVQARGDEIEQEESPYEDAVRLLHNLHPTKKGWLLQLYSLSIEAHCLQSTTTIGTRS